MAINIKELFSSDTDKDHLDKLNYNFDQVVANGGGPIGTQGTKGDLGPQGNKGSKGDQGVAGPQGATGIDTDYFFRNDNSMKFTYTPMPDDLNIPQGYNKPASLILGDAPEDLLSSNSESDSLLYIKQLGHPYLVKLGTDVATEYVTISISADGSDRDITFAPTAIGTSTQNWKFIGDSITLNGGIKLDVTASQIDSSLLLSGGLRITSGTPGVDKVLTSDAAGNASWQAPFETPIGTMVMVPKFVLDANVNWVTSGVTSADYVGRGINDWAGWYYCWGKNWGGSYETPDMREAMPIGYVNTNIGGGYSPEVYNANSTNIVTNKARVDALQSLTINTAYNHTHTTNIGNTTIEESIDANPSTTNILQPQTGGSSNFISGNPSTSTNNVNINVAPPATVLGYMIYLGSASLTYSVVSSGGGGGTIGA